MCHRDRIRVGSGFVNHLWVFVEFSIVWNVSERYGLAECDRPRAKCVEQFQIQAHTRHL
jgi:hypothetical protein